jgi:flagellar motor switch protein FliG
MIFTRKQKAAMLLMSLDTATATELLRDVKPETVRELAVELAYLDAAGYASTQESLEYAKEFCSGLAVKEKFKIKNFLREMLNNTVGSEKGEQIQNEIKGLLQQRDPFIPLRQADAQTISTALKGEHPQAVAVILSELTPKKSSDVLKLLEENIRQNVVARMTTGESITPEAKVRIAEMACAKLVSLKTGKGPAQQQLHPEESLRKVAIILRNLSRELRDGLLNAIKDKDAEAAEKVTNLMIVWDDIPLITDRSLQQILRDIEARSLALALTKADDIIIQKIRSNISERAAQTLDEEASLMSAPTNEDIQKARDEIVTVLRSKNQNGELAFIEQE